MRALTEIPRKVLEQRGKVGAGPEREVLAAERAKPGGVAEIDYLASDELEGRGVGSPGIELG